MPELPEVEKAVREIARVGKAKVIVKVDTREDAIVYSGITHEDFASEVVNRSCLDVKRYGKVFYVLLSGKGRLPVLHFGMTGMIQIKGEPSTHYRSSKAASVVDEWPPRFMKFILHFSDGAQLAFTDARRLGRIRLAADPLHEPPISDLGFDPLLCMPTREDFGRLVTRRKCPIKALLLDQSFSAGVGNWVADEILYHARVHPERRCNTLTSDELDELHRQTEAVCRIAVEANADADRFPDGWLFRYRWDKGKKGVKHKMVLPSGEPATLKWVTVGGRTSAYVEELQKPNVSQENIAAEGDKESVLTDLSDEAETTKAVPGKRKKTAASTRPRKKA